MDVLQSPSRIFKRSLGWKGSRFRNVPMMMGGKYMLRAVAYESAFCGLRERSFSPGASQSIYICNLRRAGKPIRIAARGIHMASLRLV